MHDFMTRLGFTQLEQMTPQGRVWTHPNFQFGTWFDDAQAEFMFRTAIEARLDENQILLDRINDWNPEPGQLTAANFGSAGAGLETAGWKSNFEERIAQLDQLLRDEKGNNHE
jgi:hypothetical protein